MRYQFDQRAKAAAAQLSGPGKHFDAQIWEQSEQVFMEGLSHAPKGENVRVEAWRDAVICTATGRVANEFAQQDGNR